HQWPDVADPRHVGGLRQQTSAIASFGRQSRWREAVAQFSALLGGASAGLRPDTVAVNAALAACSRGKQWALAVLLVDESRAQGLGCDLLTFTSVLTACQAASLWDRALRLVAELRSERLRPDAMTRSALISACGRASRWIEALATLCPGSDLTECNAAISSCTRGGRWALALALAAHGLDARRLQADEVTYEVTCLAAQAGGLWQAAVTALGSAWTSAQTAAPSLVSANAALSACERCTAWEAVLAIAKDMKQMGPEPDALSLGACVSALGASGRWGRALQLLEEGRHAGLTPGSFGLSCMTTALEGLWTKALCLVRDMRASQLEPNSVAFNSLSTVCVKAGRWEQALQHKEALRDVASLNVALVAAGLWASAIALYTDARSRSLEPNALSVGAAVGACASSRRWESAASLLDCGRQQGLEESTAAYNAAISSCEEGSMLWPVALSLCARMRRLGPRPDAVTAGAVVSTAAAAGRWSSALVMLRRFAQDGVRLELDGCSRRWQWQASLELVLGRCNMDAVAFGAAVSACEAVGHMAVQPSLLQDSHDEGFLGLRERAFLEAGPLSQRRRRTSVR
ncbi:unnamed protein product, partial [Polarella glacialis]